MAGGGKFLNTRQAAEYIGYSVSGFRKIVALGLIPYTKPVGRLYFKLSDLDRFLSKNF